MADEMRSRHHQYDQKTDEQTNKQTDTQKDVAIA